MPLLLSFNVLVLLFHPWVLGVQEAGSACILIGFNRAFIQNRTMFFRANEIVSFTPRRQIHGNGGL